jgi:RHS repeat-associated protein
MGADNSGETAIGRPVGEFQIDANGLAQYRVKIEVPPGIGHGNEPDISLVYSQGAPNGVLGMGWNLAGLSGIRIAPSSLAWDGVQNYEHYDRSKVRYALDGVELLNTKGEYGSSDAQYSTEVDNGKTITYSDQGFIVRDSAGQKFEYGTSTDSRLLSSDGQTVKEWRIKRQIDPYGNFVSYNYIATPSDSSKSETKWSDLNTSYIKSIVYTSNEVTKYQGRRMLLFDYTPRSDPVVHTVLGDIVIQANLLSAIHVAFKSDSNESILRSYEMRYSMSPLTRSSCLQSVFESSKATSKVSLLPTTFGYTGSKLAPEKMFRTTVDDKTSLTESRHNLVLMPMNISGLALTDLACIQYDFSSRRLSVKTYLASRGTQSPDGPAKIQWKPSNGTGAEATLPSMDIGGNNPRPSFLPADLNGDGRTDLVTPYKGENGVLVFAVSLCAGTGYLPFTEKVTEIGWSDESKFLTADLNGSGQTDIIQIYAEQGNLAFRMFPAINKNGLTTLDDAKCLRTSDTFSQTIDWLQVETHRNGAKSLVRIHSIEDAMGNQELTASTFSLQGPYGLDQEIKPNQVSSLGTYSKLSQLKMSVLACDINGDGVQDIVTCLVESHSEGEEEVFVFNFKTFLNNGMGKFIEHGGTKTHTFRTQSSKVPLRPGDFYVSNLYASDYPCLTYVYQQSDTRDYYCIAFQGTSAGVIGEMTDYKLAAVSDLVLPSDDINLSPTDLNGTGLGDWLLYTLKDDVFTVCPIYCQGSIADFLSSAGDPMGLLTEVQYSPLSNPAVYGSSQAWDNYLPPAEWANFPVLAAPNYVVSKMTTKNNTSINSIPYQDITTKIYHDARINHKGRGWQGFSKIESYEQSSNSTMIECFAQDWPLTGLRTQVDVASGKPDQAVVLRSSKYIYDSPSQKLGDWKVFHSNRTSEQTDMLEGSAVLRSYGTTYAFDADGNVLLERSWNSSGKNLWTRYSYTKFQDRVALTTGKKVSSKEQNIVMTQFQEGDHCLTLVDYDMATGKMKTLSEWSTDLQTFAKSTFEFDSFGNQIWSIDALGLETKTIFDEIFHIYPVKLTETGPGISNVRMSAYDMLTGLEVARQEADGSLTCSQYDNFNRCRSTRKPASEGESSKAALPASTFLGPGKLLLSNDFAQKIPSVQVVPYRSLEFERAKSDSGNNYLSTKSTLSYAEGPGGESEIVEVIDCRSKVQKSSHRHGKLESAWKFSKYDPRGLLVLQSYPRTLGGDDSYKSHLDWVPETMDCLSLQYDALRRPTSSSRPSHTDANEYIHSRNSYSKGGMIVDTEVFRGQKNGEKAPAEVLVSKIQKTFETISGEEKVTAQVDENGAKTMFAYDSLGRILTATDPGQKMESRSYNTGGQIARTEDPHRGVNTRKFDANNNLIEEVNAADEKIVYQRDAKGRVLKIKGHSGKTITYDYLTASNLLKSVTSRVQETDQNFEYHVQYSYDARGRAASTTITTPSNDSYTTKTQYGWQDQVISKTLPDSTLISQAHNGALLSSSRMSTPSWSVEANFDQYSAFEKPEKSTIRAGGGLQGQFSIEATFDKAGFPASRTISARSSLVQEHYIYNSLDQLSRVHEFNTGETVDYTYVARRLKSSQSGSNPTQTYDYDLSGNLTVKKDISLSYTAGKLVGTRGGVNDVEVQFDKAGRMNKRQANGAAVSFGYDGFGKLTSMIDTKSGKKVEVSYDPQGNTLIKKLPDGSLELSVSPDYRITVRADGSRRISRRVFGPDRLMATVTTDIPAKPTGPASNEQNYMNVLHTDTKGNVTHTFGSDGTLKQKFQFDAFGIMTPGSGEENSTTYESKALDTMTGLLDFGARWYDPLVGRFATPDDILDEPSLKRQDGINRYAFENNDPINHVDPTGHWSWSSALGLTAAILMIGIGIGLMFVTGGTFGIVVAAYVPDPISNVSSRENYAHVVVPTPLTSFTSIEDIQFSGLDKPN